MVEYLTPEREFGGGGVDTYLRCVVSLSKDKFTPQKVLVVPRKRWFRPDMAEKLLTGKVNINMNNLCKARLDLRENSFGAEDGPRDLIVELPMPSA